VYSFKSHRAKGVTFRGRCALSFAVRRPGASARRIVVNETGRTWHLVGDALDAIDELVTNALVPMPVISVGPGTAL